jgi:catechol 2,3-dioxygenase-like lactoylglutathione lyase family enzyme
MTVGGLHHVELWVADLPSAERSWGWLLGELGYEPYQEWSDGRSWRLASTYIVIEQSVDLVGDRHQRCAPGLNHLAFFAGTPVDVERLAEAATGHGWTLMFGDRHPHAGGPDHCAAYLENEDGFEVELCAESGD